MLGVGGGGGVHYVGDDEGEGAIVDENGMVLMSAEEQEAYAT